MGTSYHSAGTSRPRFLYAFFRCPSKARKSRNDRGTSGASSRAPATGRSAPIGAPASMKATMSPSKPTSRTVWPSSRPTRGGPAGGSKVTNFNASDGGDRPRLQQVQVTGGVEGPLDVLRAAVQPGQLLAHLRERHALLVAEHPLGVDDLRLLHHAVAGQRVVVGRGLAGDDGLAEPARGLDDHAVLAAVHRVDGEHHAGLLAVDHLLDDDGHGDVLQRALLLPVEDGAVGEEGQPALHDVVQHGLETLGVEEGLLLAGVAGALRILGAGRGADGDQAGELRERVLDQLTGRLRGRDERAGGLDVLAAHRLPQGLLVDRGGERRGGEDEAGWDGQPLGGHGGQAGALAAGQLDHLAHRVGERQHEGLVLRRHGRLLGRRYGQGGGHSELAAGVVRTSPTISTRPVEPVTRTRSPVLILRVASEVPTTAGMPNSRETTAGCEAIPPASVTRPEILVNRTTHAGLVIRQTTISSRSTSPNCSAERTTRAVPSTMPAEAGRPGISASCVGAGRSSFSGKAHSDQYGKPTCSGVAVPIQSRGRTS